MKMLLIFTPPCDAGLNLLWPPSYRRTDGDRENRTCTRSTSHRAKILVLHLLELGVGVAGAQFHVPQNHLEHGVVDGLGEVHVQLVHRRLQTWNRMLSKVSSVGMIYSQLGGKKTLFVMFQTELYLFRTRK